MFKSFPHTKVFDTHQHEERGSRQHFYSSVPGGINRETYDYILKHFKIPFIKCKYVNFSFGSILTMSLSTAKLV